MDFSFKIFFGEKVVVFFGDYFIFRRGVGERDFLVLGII